MELHLREMTLSDQDLVSALHLHEDQREFSGGQSWEIFERLRKLPFPDAVHPFMVIHDESAVGFFVLREAPALPSWALPEVVTMHNFRISSQVQRQGVGAEAVRKAA